MKLKSIFHKIVLKLLKPCIVFESYPDFSDNTKFVFDEFIKRGYDKKYYLYWFIDYDKAAYYSKGKFHFWNPKDKSSFSKYIRHLRYYNKYKATVFCNRLIVPEVFSDSQNSFYLGHGVPLKNSSKYYKTPEEIEYCISPSEAMREVIAYGHDYDINRIIPLGYPRNDALNNCKIDVKKVLQCERINKVIIWYPTFRQHKSGVKTGSPHSISFVYKEEIAIDLNDFLKSKNTMLVIKPHFGQDLAYVDKLELENIRFIDDSFYSDNGIVPYEFLASCDALLTDYSSVFFDYSLCDKPIGLIWDDINEYKVNPGLNPKYQFFTQGTEKIYNYDDLKAFISQVANSEDPCTSIRREMSKVFNISSDGKNASRVVDFIVNQAKL